MNDIAVKAEALIREHGWWNGQGVPGGKTCLGMALAFVSADSSVYSRTAGVAAGLFPSREIPLSLNGLFRFNDHPETTEEDVILVLRGLAQEDG
jgi:hypothetical protein